MAVARSQLEEFTAALKEEPDMSFTGGDFREMAQLANISRRRTARAAVQVRTPHSCLQPRHVENFFCRSCDTGVMRSVHALAVTRIF